MYRYQYGAIIAVISTSTATEVLVLLRLWASLFTSYQRSVNDVMC